MARGPQTLDGMIEQHKTFFHKEPILIMLRESYIQNYRFYFNGRLHTLCCGKGALYNGIPCIITAASSVEDFLICY